MISDFDDYMIHQTMLPVNQPVTSDRNYYDRYWFNGFDREGEFLFEIGFGLYPNRKVMDGHFSVSTKGCQQSFHSSRRAPTERMDMTIGPLFIEVLHPMRAIRVCITSNETGIECDLIFRASSVPTQEPKNLMHDELRLIMDTTRFTQMGNWEGFFSVDGDRKEVVLKDTLGIRDKSWGVRPVGEPEAGAPGLMTTEPGVYWTWAPVFFDGFSTHFHTFEDRDGNPTQLSGAKVPLYKTQEEIPRGEDPGHCEMESLKHKIHWKKGTRLAEKAEFELVTTDGERFEFTLEPMIRLQMLGIGYQHPEWGHAHWKGEEVIGSESWDLADLDMLDYKHIHNHQICKARMGDQVGVATLETICFGRHEPSGFKSILDGAE